MPRGVQIRGYALSFLLLAVALCLPVLLPRHAGHRTAWLVFEIVVASVAVLESGAAVVEAVGLSTFK